MQIPIGCSLLIWTYYAWGLFRRTNPLNACAVYAFRLAADVQRPSHIRLVRHAIFIPLFLACHPRTCSPNSSQQRVHSLVSFSQLPLELERSHVLELPLRLVDGVVVVIMRVRVVVRKATEGVVTGRTLIGPWLVMRTVVAGQALASILPLRPGTSIAPCLMDIGSRRVFEVVVGVDTRYSREELVGMVGQRFPMTVTANMPTEPCILVEPLERYLECQLVSQAFGLLSPPSVPRMTVLSQLKNPRKHPSAVDLHCPCRYSVHLV